MARVAPLNVNYRYVEEELLYLLRNSRARARRLPRRVRAARRRAPRASSRSSRCCSRWPTSRATRCCPGAVDYEAALAAASPARPAVEPSPDDLYILYTGGTTGHAEGRALALGRHLRGRDGRPPLRRQRARVARRGRRARARAAARCASLIGPPLMHGAAQWVLFITLTCGSAVHRSRTSRARSTRTTSCATVERERAHLFTIVGDAFARPLLDQLAQAATTTCRA